MTYFVDTNGPDLSAYDSDFDAIQTPERDELPDGKYQVRVESVRLESSQKGDPMIKWDLEVISGAHAGRHLFKNSVVSQASLPYVKSDLQTLGLQLAKFSDLSNRLGDLLDVTLEVTKKTRDDYTNVYFNRRIRLVAALNGEVPSSPDMPF